MDNQVKILYTCKKLGEMCGIAGIFSFNDSITEKDTVTLNYMLKSLHHRGPDSSGTHKENNIIIGNTRLSIIDPKSQSNLPISSFEDQVILCYNGEISNFNELRLKYQLNEKFPFKGSSDSEVLLYLYYEKGISIIQELTGMFAFGIIDKRINKFYLVRDFFGILPIFYTTINNKFYFASEIKALLSIPDFKRELNHESIWHYFSLGYIPSDLTPFKNIMELEAGCMIEININNYQTTLSNYYNLTYSENTTIDFNEAKIKIKDLIIDSVRRNLISDAPLGMTLSGGIDTSSMLGIVKYLGLSNKMHTFSLKMGQKSFDESPYQRIMAKFANTIHHEIEVNPNDVIDNILKQIAHTDEPSVNGACIPSFILAKEASKYVKVLLSGEGGDEVFNAYPTISAYLYRKKYRLLPKSIRSIIRKTVNHLPSNYSKLSFDFKAKRFTAGAELDVPESHLFWRHVFTENQKKQLFKNFPIYNPTSSFYKTIFDSKSNWNEINRISLIDLKYFFTDDLMVKNDRTFLANSVEGRFPFMDRFLVEFAATLPVKYKVNGYNSLRYIQKEAMRGLIPDSIINRHGFGLEMPHSIWFLKELTPFTEKYLNKNFVDKTDVLNWNFIEQLWNQHKSGKADNGRSIWGILNFLIWYDMFFIQKNSEIYLNKKQNV